MGWSKLAVIAAILTIFATVSWFGAKAGYETNGDFATFKFQQAAMPQIVDVREFYDTLDFVVTFDTGYKSLMSVKELDNYLLASGQKERGAAEYLKDLLFFNIHDVPGFVSIIFLIMLILLGVIIASTFIPFMQSGD